MGANRAALAIVKTEHGDLGEKVWLLEDEKHKFDEHYVVLAGESFAVKNQVVYGFIP